MIGRQDLFFLCLTLFLPSSSVSLSYFLLAVSMCECLGKLLRTSFPFLIAILPGGSKLMISERDYVDNSFTALNELSLRLSSYLLRLFLYLISFLLFPCSSECLGKYSCMSSPFLIAILNGTCFFRQCNYKCTMCVRSEKQEIVLH